MTIDEAIDRNKELKGELVREGRLEKAEAVQLSIEALRWRAHCERVNSPYQYKPLPGETNEPSTTPTFEP